jgi:hypothetical protein
MSSEENANGDLSIVTLPRMHAVDDQVLAGLKSSSSMQQNETVLPTVSHTFDGANSRIVVVEALLAT